MKKVFFLAMSMGISMFYSCETETVEIDERNEITQEEVVKLSTRNLVCTSTVITGFFNRAGNCIPSNLGNQVCEFIIQCRDGSIFDPGEYCVLEPCRPDFPDLPTFLNEIVPNDFINLMEAYKLRIDPSNAVVPFAINKKIAGLQFYKAAGLFKNNVYLVKKTLILDAKNSKNLGLQGNVVKAGKYPVIFNKNNGTYNVILAVEKGFR